MPEPTTTAATEVDEQIVALLRRVPNLELIDFRGLLSTPTPEIEAALDRLITERRIVRVYRLVKR